MGRSTVFFERRELDNLLRFYGRMETTPWTPYLIAPCSASIAAPAPLYQIEKRPDQARRQGAFSVRTFDGRVLRCGHDLARVLAVLEPRRMRVVST